MSFDFTDGPEHLLDFKRCHGEQLGITQNIACRGRRVSRNYAGLICSLLFRPFSGLRTALILLEDVDEVVWTATTVAIMESMVKVEDLAMIWTR